MRELSQQGAISERIRDAYVDHVVERTVLSDGAEHRLVVRGSVDRREPVKCLFGTFFESFHNRFDSLFVCGKIEKARQKMDESQLLVLRRAMFENCR